MTANFPLYRPLLLAFPSKNPRHATASSGPALRPGWPREETIAWLERAVRLEPGDYWSQFYLGYHHWRAGHNQKALEHDQAAVALQPGSPWAWFNLALLHRAADDLDLAMDDLNQALARLEISTFWKLASSSAW